MDDLFTRLDSLTSRAVSAYHSSCRSHEPVDSLRQTLNQKPRAIVDYYVQLNKLAVLASLPSIAVRNIMNKLHEDGRSRRAITITSHAMRSAAFGSDNIWSLAGVEPVPSRTASLTVSSHRLFGVAVVLVPNREENARAVSMVQSLLPTLQRLFVVLVPRYLPRSGDWNGLLRFGYVANDLFDVPGVRLPSTRSAPNLEMLHVDCRRVYSSRPGDRFNVDHPSAWELPRHWFSAGSVLRRCVLRGISFPFGLHEALKNLVLFAYDGPSNLSTRDIDLLLLNTPHLRSLRISCASFLADTPDLDHPQPELAAGSLSHIKRCVLGAHLEQDLLCYFLRRGATDIVCLGTNLIWQEMVGVLPSGATTISAGVGAVAIRYRPRAHADHRGHAQGSGSALERVRIVVRGGNGTSGSYLICAVSPTFDLSHVTHLELHEAAFLHLMGENAVRRVAMDERTTRVSSSGDTVGATTSPTDEPTSDDESTTMLVQMPSVYSLGIWLASCADHRRLKEDWLGRNFSGMFVEPPPYRNVLRDTFPGGIKHLWISAGTPSPSVELSKYALAKERNNACSNYNQDRMGQVMDLPTQLDCSCRNGYTLSLASTSEFIDRWQFDMLDELLICGVHAVDLNIAQALWSLQMKARIVKFSTSAAKCDVPDCVVDAKLDATAIFDALE